MSFASLRLSRHQSVPTDSTTTTTSQPHNQQSNPPEPQRKRGESIDMFLSRSPSQSLGTEFLKFRNEENVQSIPHLSLDMSQNNVTDVSRSNSIGFAGVQQQQQHTSSFQQDNHNAVANHSRQSSYSSAHGGDNSGGNKQRGKDTSPSCSVTGTSASSRSVSPSWNSGLHDGTRKGSMTGSTGHTINQYHQTNVGSASMPNNMNHGSFGQDTHVQYESSFPTGHHQQLYSGNNGYDSFQNQGGNSVGMNTAFNLPSNALNSSQENYNNLSGSNHSFRSSNRDEYQLNQQTMAHGFHTGLNDNSIMTQQSQKQSILNETKSQHQPQPQVFYMAVPTEDGQGQVLQPIQMQMVQIPGQPNAFVLPATAHTSNIVNMAALPQNTHVTIGGGFQNSQGLGDRKSYNNLQGSRQQLESSKNQYYEDGFDHGYSDDITSYGDKQYRGRVASAERKDSMTNGTNDIVASLYASPQRPPLRELLGHVRRLSRDQVGCRLLQQALDEEGASAASLILKEGLSFWGEAMVDPFGNYLFQKILEKITAEERIILVQNVSPRLVNASLNLHGTRSVQKVVELCAIDEKENPVAPNGDKKQETASEILTRSLTPAAARLCIDSHGNHVIQRILLKLPYQYSHFVFDAVANSVGDVARHRHGCCVIQRCLDSPPSAARSNLVNRIVEKSLELMQDAYGNYVVQYVLDVCSDDDVHAVCESVVGKVTLLAIQKFSSNVMEKCLERCTDKVREHYLAELSDSERIRELMMDPFGNYVIQRALAVSTHAQAVTLVEAMKPHLFATGGGIKNTAGGRRILAKISKRFPNFSLGDELGESDILQKHGHKKSGNNRNDSNVSMDQASARFNRRGQGKSDEYNE